MVGYSIARDSLLLSSLHKRFTSKQRCIAIVALCGIMNGVHPILSDRTPFEKYRLRVVSTRLKMTYVTFDMKNDSFQEDVPSFLADTSSKEA